MNFKLVSLCVLFGLTACTSMLVGPYSFTYSPIQTKEFEIATWQSLTNASEPVHIYIEGDGYAFNRKGVPTGNPTPRSQLVRNLAARDGASNVVYMARPCQYIKSPSCDVSDWTDGRFSTDVLESMHTAIKIIAKNRPIVLIGYSGGAMVSGLLIQKYPDLNVQKWITVAGVLNHKDWTQYFGDAPLNKSLNLNVLPHISQTHYIADGDTVVPNELTRRWTKASDIVVIKNAKHDSFRGLEIDFE